MTRLLELAAAPPQSDELVGRRAAVAEFVRVRRGDVAPPAPVRGRRVLVPLLSKAIAVKVVAGLAVLLLGGMAVAAGTGSLPTAVQHGAHELLSPFGVPVPDSGTGAGDGTGPGGHPSTTPHPGPGGAAADPEVHGLCQVWETGQRSGHAKEVASNVLRALAAAAGGTDRIPAFCAALLAQPVPGTPAPSSSPAESPSPAGAPSAAGGMPTPTPSHPGKDKGRGKPSTSLPQ